MYMNEYIVHRMYTLCVSSDSSWKRNRRHFSTSWELETRFRFRLFGSFGSWCSDTSMYVYIWEFVNNMRDNGKLLDHVHEREWNSRLCLYVRTKEKGFQSELIDIQDKTRTLKTEWNWNWLLVGTFSRHNPFHMWLNVIGIRNEAGHSLTMQFDLSSLCLILKALNSSQWPKWYVDLLVLVLS